MRNPEVFRTKSSTISAGIVLVLISGLNIQNWLSSSFASSLVTLVWSIFFCSIIYLVIYKPKILIFDEGITITNPVKEFTVGWDQIDEVEAKYSMSILLHDGREIFAWAAPAPGRYHARSIHPSEVRGMKLGEIIRPGESPRSDSGVAKHLVTARLNKFRAVDAMAVETSVVNRFAGISVTAVSFIVGIFLYLIHF